MWQDRLVSIDALRLPQEAQPLSQWLSPAELQRLAEMPSAARQRHWLGGRWVAKHLLAELLDDPLIRLPDLHIESRDALDRASRPRVLYRGRLRDWQLTISHAARSVYVAASIDPACRLGCDITDLTPLDEAFARFWFTPGERAWCRPGRYPLAGCAIWSLKESWYKAAGEGQPFSPRGIDVTQVTPISALSPAEFCHGERGEFTLDGSLCTVLCRRFPQETTTLVLLRGGRAAQARTRPALSTTRFPIRQE